MVTSKRKLMTAIVLIILLATLVLLVFFGATIFKPAPQHGEGYMDPSSGIHIIPTGEITDSGGNASNANIRRDGNTYTLIGNTTSPLTIEKSNIVFDGGGFSFIGSQGLIISGASNVTVEDLNVETHYLRIKLDNTQNSVLRNVTSSYWIMISYSRGNLIDNCTGYLELENSNGNTIKNCFLKELRLTQSNGNSILYNTISVQGRGIGLWGSSNNIVFGNTFLKFWWWIGIGGDSNNNKIVANNVWAGQLYFEDKLEGTNYIYHNNFYNFKWNTSATTNSANIWSSEGKGNYWGYSGSDINHDGICDLPHTIDRTNTDNYPLMMPVDIATEPLP